MIGNNVTATYGLYRGLPDVPLNVTSPDICLSPAQYAALKQQILISHIEWAWIAALVGLAVGMLTMYYYVRYRRDKDGSV